MPGAEIRHVQPEEKIGWLRAMRTTFLVDPAAPITTPIEDWWDRVWDVDRIWGAFDEDRCVATLRTFPTMLTVPSASGSAADVRADALTQVTVAATHRRRGLLSGMLTGSLADAKDRGEAVSVLRSAEWPIYGRFGYQVSTRATDYTVRLVPRQHAGDPGRPVTVHQLDPADLLQPASAVLAQARALRAGQIVRPPAMWDRVLGLNGMPVNGGREPICVLARDSAGTPVGYALWTATEPGTMHDHGEVTVHELITLDLDGYRALWNYLLGLDLVSRIRWPEHPVDEPLEWLLADGRAARRTHTYDSLWVRILDVPVALQARRYAVEDRIVLDVVDAEGGLAAGRVVLDAGPSHAECQPRASASPDLRLSQRALAAVYLGGISLRSQCVAGLVDEHTPGAVQRLEAMVATTAEPWNSTPF